MVVINSSGVYGSNIFSSTVLAKNGIKYSTCHSYWYGCEEVIHISGIFLRHAVNVLHTGPCNKGRVWKQITETLTSSKLSS